MFSIASLRKCARPIWAALFVLLPAATGHAAPITYKFTGYSTLKVGLLDIPARSHPITGTFTYDPGLARIDATSGPKTANYGVQGRAGSAAPSLKLSIGEFATFDFAGHDSRTISVSNNGAAPPPHESTTGHDKFVLSIRDGINNGVGLTLEDPTGRAFSGTQIPPALDLSKFSVAHLTFGSPQGYLMVELTGLELTQTVPEPSALAVFGLGALGLAVARRKVRGKSARLES